MSANVSKAISVNKVTKSFRIPLENSSGIKQKFINVVKGKKGYRDFTPLKDVEFSINEGEFFGIVGRNGSGKSTLLKLIAGIYTPDTGSVDVKGTLIPFIELGVGFNPELSGKENVYLNGALLGFSRKEMTEMYNDIVDFAELHSFMEERLKNYSSGMQVRLAFSIAIRAKSDILLLDEILAVGDEAFQKKCIDYFYKIKKSGQTVILVTHDMSNVERFCDRALVLNNGKVEGIFTPAKAKLIYNQLNREQESDKDGNVTLDSEWGTKEVIIKKITLNGSAKRRQLLENGEEFILNIELSSNEPRDVIIGLAFYDQNGLILAGPNSEEKIFKSNDKITYTVPRNPLGPGEYKLRIGVFADDHYTEYDHKEDVFSIEVASKAKLHGKVNLFGQWKASKEDDYEVKK